MKFTLEIILLAILIAIAIGFAIWHRQYQLRSGHSTNNMTTTNDDMEINSPDHPFYRLLDTKYDEEREDEALEILNAHPEIAKMKWPGPDEQGTPFIKDSTPLHYAANDGKIRLMKRLIELGADVNASEANWYRSVLSWAANNARIDAVKLLLENGAKPDSLNAVHAAAYGGSDCGAEEGPEYVETIKILLAAGADKDDRRYHDDWTPLRTALDSGNKAASEYLKSIGAAEE